MTDNNNATPAPDCGRAKTKPGRNGYRHRQQYGIVVICDNEQAQQRTYNHLKKAGYARLRVVAV